MAVIWHKTKFLGVRFREHAARMHGKSPDRCFSIRYKVDGKDKEEVVGWASGGINAEKAYRVLSVIRDNIRLGVEPRSIAAIRQANDAQIEEEAKARHRKEKEELTFAEFWEQEYLPTAEATKKAVTIENECWLYAKWIAPSLANIPLRKIDVAKIEAMAAHVQKAGKSAATIRYLLGIVSQGLNKAAVYGVIPKDNPCRYVKKPRQDNRRMRFLSRDEARELLVALAERSPDICDEALLSLICGLRAGEVHALTWGDVNMEDGSIFIKDPKNKHNRHAFMTEEIRAMFTGRMKGQRKSDLVFPAVNGKQRRWISDSFVRTVGALGLNDNVTDARQRVVFHTLRHTFASWLVQDGTPLYTVAELMGHTTLEMTRRYSRLAPDSLRKAAMNLQGKLELQKSNTVAFREKSSAGTGLTSYVLQSGSFIDHEE